MEFIYKLIASFFKPSSQFGLVPDPRSKEEKAKDFTHEELAGGISQPIVWVEKTSYKNHTPRNQALSSSCVGQAVLPPCPPTRSE